MRSTTNDAANRVQTSTVGRATLREVDDNHLCQECKHADTGFSRTHSDFEMWHPLGMTSVPMKQKEQQQAQQAQQAEGWNKQQPKGAAAEAMVLYVGGSAAHPVGLANDRRVRPYDMKPGEAAMYSADGSGQTVYHRVRNDGNDGVFMISCDGPSQGEDGKGSGQKQSRCVSIRHANKPLQDRKPKKQQGGATPQGGQQQQQESYKHEGQSINTEVRLDSKKINFNDGGGNVGFFDSGKKDWLHHDGQGATHSMRADKGHSHIKHEGGHIWVDGACWSSMPIQIKGDPCS